MLRVGLWACPVLLLAIALLDMPYGYYQVLRVVVFCASAYLGLYERNQNEEVWSWAFFGCALIYNPIFKLSLGADLWPFANVATIILFGSHYWLRGRAGLDQRGY